MSSNVITPDDKREELQKLTIGDLTVSEEGNITGYISVAIRDEIDFEELLEESDRVVAQAEISFQKKKDDFHYPLD